MTERRTPRAHLQSTAVGPDNEDTVPVTPALVEHLERQFPVTLSLYLMGPGSDLHVLNDQAEQRGRQQVIDYLRNLSANPST